jgi:hypothetical protein
MKRVAILQSNYIPWKGVFDLIDRVDAFVFFEDVDFTKRDWRTRNFIKTQNGRELLTVPVKKMPRGAKINEIEISEDGNWRRKHEIAIRTAYGKAAYFKDFSFLIDEIFANVDQKSLSQFNIRVTKLICEVLGINADFYDSSNILSTGSSDDKLISICEALNADVYLSGPAAKVYIEESKFHSSNIKLEYITYSYQRYSQLFGSFDHYVSVLDLIFNCGPDSRELIRKDGELL